MRKILSAIVVTLALMLVSFGSFAYPHHGDFGPGPGFGNHGHHGWHHPCQKVCRYNHRYGHVKCFRRCI